VSPAPLHEGGYRRVVVLVVGIYFGIGVPVGHESTVGANLQLVKEVDHIRTSTRVAPGLGDPGLDLQIDGQVSPNARVGDQLTCDTDNRSGVYLALMRAIHSVASTTEACRGNTFSMRTRWTSPSRSRQPSRSTVRT
jgi:hypothetical protein